MDKIIIIGGLGTALNIAEAITDAIEKFNYQAELLGFANDILENKLIGDFPIVTSIAKIQELFIYDDIKFIYALYKPDLMLERTKMFEKLSIPPKLQINFIHPSAYISKSSSMGYGNVVLQNSTIQSSVSIGNNSIISSNCVIEHDSVIGNNNFVAAGSIIGSKVKIDNSCFVGLNSTIRENTSLATNTFLGMGSLLLDNTSQNEIWYGVPARKK